MNVQRISRRLTYWLFAALAGAMAGGAADAQTVTRAIEGQLAAVWADPRPGFSTVSGEPMRFNITTADGRTIPLDVAAWQRTAAIGAFGKRVRIEGREPAVTTQASDGPQPFIVDKLSVLEAPQAQAQVAPALLVQKRVLFVLLKYQGDTQRPHPPFFFKALTNPLTPNATYHIPATINGYFYNTSYRQLRWQADVVGATGLTSTDWLTLPKPKSGYANCGWSSVCLNHTLMANDALNMVTALGVNLSVYSNINFVINNDLDCCAWGGGISYGGRFYGATWEPPWGQEAGIYVHEMGHSLGLPHSGWKYYAYDSPWDDMSRGRAAQSVQCGTYRSANSSGANNALYCTEPGGGYITAHKDALNWIPATRKSVIDKVSTTTLTLEANALPLGTALKMIKICLPGEACTGSTAHYLTVEARLRSAQYEMGLPNEGVIIHDVRRNRAGIGAGNPCFFNSQSGWAVPIDATDGDYAAAPACNSGGRAFPDWGLFNAQFGVGTFYNSTLYGVRVNVLSKTATSFRVRVTRTK